MNRISDNLKIDTAYLPLSRTSGNSAGEYFSMAKYRRACFVVSCATVADTYAIAAQVMQATDAAASGAKAVTNAAATITANTKASKVLLTTRSVAAADVVTINGLVFTGGTATVLATRTFKADGNDAADATALCACINDTTYGVPGVLATLATDTVILTAIEPGEQYITVSDESGTIVSSTLQSTSFVEVDASALDSANGFDHVALRLTTTSTVLVSASLIRDCKVTPTQYVADSKANVA
jgi:hypothetical protein